MGLVSEMDDKPITPAHAWQPFTPRGIAAFAHATLTRVLLVQGAGALLVAAVAVWLLASQCFPVVEEAIREIPAGTVIRGGTLQSSNSAPNLLAGNRALEFIINPRDIDGAGGTADLSVVLTSHAVQVCGLLGCAELPYARGYLISLNRNDLEPWWGAWRKAVAAVFAAVVILQLLLPWWFLGLLAAPLVRLIAFYADREVSLGASWRLANAAFMPGALIVAMGLVLYGLGAIDVVRLTLLYVLHFVCGFVFLCTSPFFLPHVPGANAVKNPFNTGEPKPAGDKPQKKARNPFA